MPYFPSHKMHSLPEIVPINTLRPNSGWCTVTSTGYNTRSNPLWFRECVWLRVSSYKLGTTADDRLTYTHLSAESAFHPTYFFRTKLTTPQDAHVPYVTGEKCTTHRKHSDVLLQTLRCCWTLLRFILPQTVRQNHLNEWVIVAQAGCHRYVREWELRTYWGRRTSWVPNIQHKQMAGFRSWNQHLDWRTDTKTYHRGREVTRESYSSLSHVKQVVINNCSGDNTTVYFALLTVYGSRDTQSVNSRELSSYAHTS
jgi:hypothetical protein